VSTTRTTEPRAEKTWDGIPARIFLQPIAPPSILGLFGFMGATMMAGSYLAGWWGDTGSLIFLVPFALVFGGVAQFLAGMWSYRARDGLATAMHGTWGSFWIGWGILYLLDAAGTITLPVEGTAFPAFGFWFIVLAAITWSGAIAALGESLGLFAVLATLATGSSVLAAALWVGADVWIKVAGWLFVFAAGFAWYVATAMMLEGAMGRTILPLGKYKASANIPGGRPTRPVEYEAGRPGVRVGQ
jgi:succinate-acetate transporter protein